MERMSDILKSLEINNIPNHNSVIFALNKCTGLIRLKLINFNPEIHTRDINELLDWYYDNKYRIFCDDTNVDINDREIAEDKLYQIFESALYIIEKDTEVLWYGVQKPTRRSKRIRS